MQYCANLSLKTLFNSNIGKRKYNKDQMVKEIKIEESLRYPKLKVRVKEYWSIFNSESHRKRYKGKTKRNNSNNFLYPQYFLLFSTNSFYLKKMRSRLNNIYNFPS